jgi:hypothetical protein
MNKSEAAEMPEHSNGYGMDARVRETGEPVSVFRYLNDPAYNYQGRTWRAWLENGGCRWWRDDELEPV